MDGKRRGSTSQEDERAIRYIQNAEQQNSSAIWKKLKGL